jgi:hypothetical protein
MSNSAIKLVSNSVAKLCLPMLQAKCKDFTLDDAELMATSLLAGIGYGEDVYRLAPQLAIYIGKMHEINISDPPARTMALPSVVTPIRIEVGDMFGIDESINKRWPLTVIRKIVRPYSGVCVLFVGVVVADAAEMEMLVNAVSLKLGCSAQEESLPKSGASQASPDSPGTVPAP